MTDKKKHIAVAAFAAASIAGAAHAASPRQECLVVPSQGGYGVEMYDKGKKVSQSGVMRYDGLTGRKSEYMQFSGLSRDPKMNTVIDNSYHRMLVNVSTGEAVCFKDKDVAAGNAKKLFETGVDVGGPQIGKIDPKTDPRDVLKNMSSVKSPLAGVSPEFQFS